MTNPCDVGMCDPSRCHDQDCINGNSEEKAKDPRPEFIDHITNQQDEEGSDNGNS